MWLATIGLAFVSLLTLVLATSLHQSIFLVNGFQQMIWVSSPFIYLCFQYFCRKIQFSVFHSVFPWKFKTLWFVDADQSNYIAGALIGHNASC